MSLYEIDIDWTYVREDDGSRHTAAVVEDRNSVVCATRNDDVIEVLNLEDGTLRFQETVPWDTQWTTDARGSEFAVAEAFSGQEVALYELDIQNEEFVAQWNSLNPAGDDNTWGLGVDYTNGVIGVSASSNVIWRINNDGSDDWDQDIWPDPHNVAFSTNFVAVGISDENNTAAVASLDNGDVQWSLSVDDLEGDLTLNLDSFDERDTFLFGSDSHVFEIDESGNILWSNEIEWAESRIQPIIPADSEEEIIGLYDGQGELGLYEVEGHTEEQNISLVGRKKVSDGFSSRLTSADSFEDGSFIITGSNENGDNIVRRIVYESPPVVDVEGHVYDQDSEPVEGAKVYMINDEENTVYDVTFTDGTGYFLFEDVLAETDMHAAVEYEDDQGSLYNAESLPFLNYKEEEGAD